jgi:hypothetical protein
MFELLMESRRLRGCAAGATLEVREERVGRVSPLSRKIGEVERRSCAGMRDTLASEELRARYGIKCIVQEMSVTSVERTVEQNDSANMREGENERIAITCLKV